MDLEKRPAEQPARQTPEQPARQNPEQPPRQNPEGCLTVAIRIPVRIVVLVLVVPVRMVWDALVVTGRFLRDTVLRPVGRALAWTLLMIGRALFVWPWVALWRYVVVPVGRALGWLGNVLVVVPLVWLYRWVLTPIGHGIAWAARGVGAGLVWLYTRLLTPVGVGLYTAVAWLVRYLFVVPALWVYAWVLTPVGHAIAWCARGLVLIVSAIVTGIGTALYWTARILFVLPALAVWRWVLTPVGRALAVVGREIRDALGHAWRVAGYISLAVGRFLATLFRWIFVEPVRWVYRTVLTPVGHVIRDTVLRPATEAARAVGRATRQALTTARDSVRQARSDVRRMLFGEPRRPEPVAHREPIGHETRTLGSSTTALTKD
ncbi:integral membrane protein [Streptomyces lincolnensis]|uniref:Integral membrane protein n=1 Tax=Streptomyces lincolnensis TaxID=1915 RepID=A0A1B1M9C2_STRLN|nr:hypothetical protein [Streptomyces lincolnensis]ANS65226.1 integral membrane protein [Streptomyces lincolnensis]AXG56566.1 integral membrane protein [Streptomyces lincolnensis]QMV07002.1 hypothetical protein GJU35_15825 [Streptomyces lincolnensis]